MEYIAARYARKEETEKPYFTLQEALRGSKSDASVFRVMIKERWHIVILGEIDTIVRQAIKRHIPSEKWVDLPLDSLQLLVSRRIERADTARKMPGRGNFRMAEVHTPVPLYNSDRRVSIRAKDVKNLAHDESMRHTEATDKPFRTQITASNVQGLQAGQEVTVQVIPFVKAFLDLSEMRTNQEIMHLIAPDVRTAVEGEAVKALQTVQRVNSLVLKHATKYLFTLSALRLQQAVFSPDVHTQAPLPENFLTGYVWIECERPVDTPYAEQVKAVYLNRAYPEMEIERLFQKGSQERYMLNTTFGVHKGQWSLVIVNARCDTLFDLTFDTGIQQWRFLGSHICPYGTCKYTTPNSGDVVENTVKATCEPCEKCREAVNYFAQWLITALKIIHREYTVTLTPEPFRQSEQEYTQIEKVTVGKGKNKHKIPQKVTRSVTYTVIDVSVPASVKSQQRSQEEAKAEKRQNWLTLHGSEDRIYEKKYLPDTVRHYRGDYFRALIERVRQGDLLSPEGEEYELIEEKDGSYTVIGKVRYPHGKYVPMLRPELKKQITYKKIVASQYEAEADM